MLFLETWSWVMYKSVPSLAAGDVRAFLRWAPRIFVLAGVAWPHCKCKQASHGRWLLGTSLLQDFLTSCHFSFPSLLSTLLLAILLCQLCQSLHLFCVPSKFINPVENSPLFSAGLMDIIASWRICWAPEGDRWLERRKGDVKDFPLLVKWNTYRGWSLFLVLTLHAAQSPFSRALNRVPAFKLVLFRTKAAVLNHTRTFKSFYSQAYLLSFWLQ